MITTYSLFLETGTFKQKTPLDDPFDDKKKYGNLFPDKPFTDDAELISQIYIERRNKVIRLSWKDTLFDDHLIKDRIKNRTTLVSVSEFNRDLEKNLLILFDKYLDGLSKKLNISHVNKIAIHIRKMRAYVIIEYDPNYIYQNFTPLSILTIIPDEGQAPSTIVANRIFYL